MSKRLLMRLGALIAVFSFAPHAAAQIVCVPESALIKGLAKHSEQRTRAGISKDGSAIFELWLNTDTRTFTVTVRSSSRPNILCIIAAGVDWHDISTTKGEDT